MKAVRYRPLRLQALVPLAAMVLASFFLVPWPSQQVLRLQAVLHRLRPLADRSN